MFNFIELHLLDEEKTVLLPLAKIYSIVNVNGLCFVETGVDKNGDSLGFFIKESYQDILQQVEKYCV